MNVINVERKNMPLSENLKRNPALAILGVILLSLGIWLDIVWIPDKPDPSLYLLNLVPGLILLFTWFRSVNNYDVKWIIGLGSVFTILITVVVIFINIGAAAFADAITPIEDVNRYPEFQAELKDSKLFQHFPDTIPTNATDVKFYMLPAFLQGGTIIELKYRLSQEEITALLYDFRSSAVVHTGNCYLSDTDYPIEDMSSFCKRYLTSDMFPVNSNPEVFILDSIPEGEPDFIWNHGSCYGVAIDLKSSTILYWLDDW
jgi:hypothetical protein